MKNFKYWVCECKKDGRCYSLIGKTKKEVIRQMIDLGDLDYYIDYGEEHNISIHKIEIPCKDVFELFDIVTDEGGSRAMMAYSMKEYKYKSNDFIHNKISN